MTSFCKLNSCIKLMLNWKYEVGRRKLYQWTTILLDSHNCNLYRTATRRTLYIAKKSFTSSNFCATQACVFWTMTYHWMCRLLFNSVCLQTTSSARMVLEVWERNDIRCYCNFKDDSKQSTRNITLENIIVFILNKVSDLFWNTHLI